MTQFYGMFHNRIANDTDLGIQNGPRSNVNTPFESQQATPYVSAIVIAPSVTVYAVEICMTLTLTFKMGKCQMQVHPSKANRRLPMYCYVFLCIPMYFYVFLCIPMYSYVFLCTGDCNICPICYRLRDIHNQSFDDFILTFRIGRGKM